MLIELTSSELMALKELVAEHLLVPDRIEVYINVSEYPPVHTTPEDLLRVLMTQEPV